MFPKFVSPPLKLRSVFLIVYNNFRPSLPYNSNLFENVLQAWITLVQLILQLFCFFFQMHYTKYCKEMLSSTAVEQVHLSLDFFLCRRKCPSEKGHEWCSGDSTVLPSRWPVFECWRRRHTWVEFCCCWISPLLRKACLLNILKF